jgi:hypothetical protein
MFGGEPAGADKLEKLKEVTFNKIFKILKKFSFYRKPRPLNLK